MILNQPPKSGRQRNGEYDTVHDHALQASANVRLFHSLSEVHQVPRLELAQKQNSRR